MLNTIEIELKSWGKNSQVIWDNLSIASLIQRVEDWVYKTESFNMSLKKFNLSNDSFECKNLFQFLLHMKKVNNADLKYPIIMNNEWQIIDWRHRICKAVIKWKKKIKVIKILDSSII